MTEPRGAGPIGPDEFASVFRESFGPPEGCGPLILAVSGGPDSVALMHAAGRWAQGEGGPRLQVATVDHGLRPEARAEADGVAIAARALGLEHRVLTWTRYRDGRVSQDSARRARYRLLSAHARKLGATALVTAHTLDDQAETLLMRMAAGSGLAGLAGMRAVGRTDGLLHLRPFLRFAKARLLATCGREGWGFVTDPSNADDRFARSRWRRLLPGLAAEGLDAARLARLAVRLARADAALDAAAAAALGRWGARDGSAVDFRSLAAEPEEVSLRALGLLVEGAPAAPGPSAGAGAEPSDGKPVRLERLETCLAALRAASADGRPVRRTLAGRLLALDRLGRLTVGPEPPRSRGRATALTLPAARTPHSLGTEGTRA